MNERQDGPDEPEGPSHDRALYHIINLMKVNRTDVDQQRMIEIRKLLADQPIPETELTLRFTKYVIEATRRTGRTDDPADDTRVSQALPCESFEPPRNSLFLLSLFAPLETQEEIIGDMNERYRLQIGRQGLPRARWWYRWHTAQVVGAFAIRWGLRAIGIAKVIGWLRS